MGDSPEYMNDFAGGGSPDRNASRAERMKAAGNPEGETLAELNRRQNEAAWANSGSQEDPGAEFQRANSKMGRENLEMTSKDIMAHAQELAKKSGRQISESGLIQEPETTKSIVGYSEEKKAKLAKSKKSSKSKE